MQLRITIIAVLLFGGQVSAQKTIDRNFALVDDFEIHQRFFSSDTFDLPDHSVEGGMAVVFHSTQMQYGVVDVWLFGELGKIHLTFWTENDWKVMIVKRTDFHYDKPFYEKDYKMTETTEYFSYLGNAASRYNAHREKLNEPIAEQMQIENERLLRSIHQKLRIIR